MLDTVEEMLCITLEMVLLMLFQTEDTTDRMAFRTLETAEEIRFQMEDTTEKMAFITLKIVPEMLFQMEETTFQIADRTDENETGYRIPNRSHHILNRCQDRGNL